jgi:hypothetical protein
MPKLKCTHIDFFGRYVIVLGVFHIHLMHMRTFLHGIEHAPLLQLTQATLYIYQIMKEFE